MRGHGESNSDFVAIPHGSFDLIIMNPPFTRPTNHALTRVPIPSFAAFSTEEEEMKLMSDRLKKMQKPSMIGNGYAGLSSNFFDLAHVKLKVGGTLALVLPSVFLQGQSWAAARRLLDESYKDVTIVSIAANKAIDRAFSADTNMAEVLVIATKKDVNSKTKDSKKSSTLFVNLLRRPKSILEAVTTARVVQRIPSDTSISSIKIGSKEKAGCVIRGTLTDSGCAGLREANLARMATGLVQGELRLPRQNNPIPLDLTQLSELGNRGLVDRLISGSEYNNPDSPNSPFDIVPLQKGDFPNYPVLWAHDAKRETRLIVLPDRMGEIRPNCDEKANDVWKKTASRLHFNRDFTNQLPTAGRLFDS